MGRSKTVISSSPIKNLFGQLGEIVSSVTPNWDNPSALMDRKKKTEGEKERALELMNDSVQEYLQTCSILRNELENLESISKEICSSFESLGILLVYSKAENPVIENLDLNDSVATEAALNGVVIGSLAAGSAMFLTSMFCTAGTGAAISGLSGTYALNATLAVLGGGTIVSGGLGIAGGIATASALFIVPAVIFAMQSAKKKIQRLEQNTKEIVKQVGKAVELNAELRDRNLNAARKIRQLYFLGAHIKFLLANIERNPNHNPAQINATRDKIGKAFLGIKIFSGREINAQIDSSIQEIEGEISILGDVLARQDNSTQETFNERSIKNEFHKIYEDAEEFLYLSYPWYNVHCVNRDISKIKEAIKKGVKVMICYGFGNDSRVEETKKLIVKKFENLNVSLKFVNSHQKIAVCDKYVLYGSQNMMSYEYPGKGGNDKHSEITVRDSSRKMIEYFRTLIEKEPLRKVD